MLKEEEKAKKDYISRRRGLCKILMSENPPPKFASVKDSSKYFHESRKLWPCTHARTASPTTASWQLSLGHYHGARHSSSSKKCRGTLDCSSKNAWLWKQILRDAVIERCQQDCFWAWPPDRIEPVRLHKRNCVCVDTFSTVNNIPCNFWAFAKVEQI